MKKNRQKKRSSSRPSSRLMDEKKIQAVVEWLERMKTHLKKSIELSEKSVPDGFDKDSDYFWALAKYAENVQECVTQLDKINKSIFPCLIEIPSKASSSDDLSWDGLKGMRIRLAHKFWNIDPDILWNTVRRDFPILMDFLNTLIVSLHIGCVDGVVETDRFLKLTPVSDGDKLEYGNSFPMLYFDEDGSAQCFRVGRKSNRELVISHSAKGHYSLQVWGRRKSG